MSKKMNQKNRNIQNLRQEPFLRVSIRYSKINAQSEQKDLLIE